MRNAWRERIPCRKRVTLCVAGSESGPKPSICTKPLTCSGKAAL
ncbi:Uncharacterised protein [Vibrio cholerae]|nr:Uncharacterised protein [Vibrio cholerae]